MTVLDDVWRQRIIDAKREIAQTEAKLKELDGLTPGDLRQVEREHVHAFRMKHGHNSPGVFIGLVLFFGVLGWPIAHITADVNNWHWSASESWWRSFGFAAIAVLLFELSQYLIQLRDTRRATAQELTSDTATLRRQLAELKQSVPDMERRWHTEKLAEQQEAKRQQELAAAQARAARLKRVAELEGKLLDVYAEFSFTAEVDYPGITDAEILKLFAEYPEVMATIGGEKDGWLLGESSNSHAQVLWQALQSAGNAPSAPRQVAGPRTAAPAPAKPKDAAVARYEQQQRESAERRRRWSGE
jgi:hypothetical protein